MRSQRLRAGGLFSTQRKLKDSEEMDETLEIFEQACAGYLLYCGVQLVRIIPGSWCRYAFANDSGQASKALDDWRSNAGLVRVREYSKAYSTIIRMTKMTRQTEKVVDDGSRVGAA
jgi:hypothetical protein